AFAATGSRAGRTARACGPGHASRGSNPRPPGECAAAIASVPAATGAAALAAVVGNRRGPSRLAPIPGADRGGHRGPQAGLARQEQACCFPVSPPASARRWRWLLVLGPDQRFF